MEGDENILVGFSTTINDNNRIIVGSDNVIKGNNNFIIGRFNEISGCRNTCFGSSNNINNNQNLVIGHANLIDGIQNIVIGSHNRGSISDNGLAFGMFNRGLGELLDFEGLGLVELDKKCDKIIENLVNNDKYKSMAYFIQNFNKYHHQYSFKGCKGVECTTNFIIKQLIEDNIIDEETDSHPRKKRKLSHKKKDNNENEIFVDLTNETELNPTLNNNENNPPDNFQLISSSSSESSSSSSSESSSSSSSESSESSSSGLSSSEFSSLSSSESSILSSSESISLSESFDFDTDDSSDKDCKIYWFQDSPDEIENKIYNFGNLKIGNRVVTLLRVPGKIWKRDYDYDTLKLKKVGVTIRLGVQGIFYNKFKLDFNILNYIESGDIKWKVLFKAITEAYEEIFSPLLLKGNDKEAEEDEDTCSICFLNRPNVKLNDCGHSTFCVTCINTLIQTHGQCKCPVCRKSINSKPKIFRYFIK